MGVKRVNEVTRREEHERTASPWGMLLFVLIVIGVCGWVGW